MTDRFSDSERGARTLLVVDDDEVFRTRLVQAFRVRGFDVVGVSDHDAAIQVAEQDTPELAVVDLRLPGKSGLEVVRDLKQLDSTTTIVVLTGYGSIATALESVQLGARTYLTKPADTDQVLAAFEGSVVTADQAPASVPSLARVEWEHINRVLSDCGGNISQAARLLGIHRRSLQRKIAKYPVRQ